ncbi:hypothetical protein UB46_07540 [Burkholderiaceae bacterium 16]|nr:hypothetical protein UB46_07540 [Burkholderiaceae bacterium 16]
MAFQQRVHYLIQSAEVIVENAGANAGRCVDAARRYAVHAVLGHQFFSRQQNAFPGLAFYSG